jgi:hypothetical protein
MTKGECLQISCLLQSAAHPLIDGGPVVACIMKPMQGPVAKILLHSDGLGVPSPETVRQRASELSRINGHSSVTQNDWQQAKREVHGGHSNGDGEDAMPESASERDMIATDHGHRAGKFIDDTEHAVEELVAEGLDEAMHDQMLKACAGSEEAE